MNDGGLSRNEYDSDLGEFSTQPNQFSLTDGEGTCHVRPSQWFKSLTFEKISV